MYACVLGKTCPMLISPSVGLKTKDAICAYAFAGMVAKFGHY